MGPSDRSSATRCRTWSRLVRIRSQSTTSVITVFDVVTIQLHRGWVADARRDSIKKVHVVSVAFTLSSIVAAAFVISRPIYQGNLAYKGSLAFSQESDAASAFSDPFLLTPEMGEVGLVISIGPSHESQQTVNKLSYSTLIRGNRYQLESVDGTIFWLGDDWIHRPARRRGGKRRSSKRVEFLLKELRLNTPMNFVLKVFPSQELVRFATDIPIELRVYRSS